MTNLSLQKDKIKILLLEGLHQSAVDTFTNAGYTNIESIKTALSEEELCEKIKDVHFVGIRSRTHLNANFIADGGAVDKRKFADGGAVREPPLFHYG